MTHYLFHAILILFIALTPMSLYAGSDDPIDVETDDPIDVEFIKDPDMGDNRRRVPPMRIYGMIDFKGGVTIDGVDPFDIISYEIYTETGETVGIFADEQSFLSCLRGCTGTLRIVLRTPSASYSGLLSL